MKAKPIKTKNIVLPVLYLLSKNFPIYEAIITGKAIYAETFAKTIKPSLHHGASLLLLFSIK